jgi:hypothetical protein
VCNAATLESRGVRVVNLNDRLPFNAARKQIVAFDLFEPLRSKRVTIDFCSEETLTSRPFNRRLMPSLCVLATRIESSLL